MNYLQAECAKCKVADTCPRKGSSPLIMSGGTKKLFCNIIGGYSKTPVDKSILSPESLERYEKDGPCLTIAEVPTRNNDGNIITEVVKIFSNPILHEREKTNMNQNMIYPKSHS
jgi:hypothetical protein